MSVVPQGQYVGCKRNTRRETSTGREPCDQSESFGLRSGRSSLGKGGPDKRVDVVDAELEYDNDLEGDGGRDWVYGNDRECDNSGLEFTLGSGLARRFCV